MGSSSGPGQSATESQKLAIFQQHAHLTYFYLFTSTMNSRPKPRFLGKMDLMTELVQPFCLHELLHISPSWMSSQSPALKSADHLLYATYVKLIRERIGKASSTSLKGSSAICLNISLPRPLLGGLPLLSQAAVWAQSLSCPCCCSCPVLSWFWRLLAFPLLVVFTSATYSCSSNSGRLRTFGLSPPGFGTISGVF